MHCLSFTDAHAFNRNGYFHRDHTFILIPLPLSSLGGIRFTQQEIGRFYGDRDVVLDEFDEEVMEIEMCNFGHETPSVYSDSEDSEDSETPPYCPEMTPVAPVYSDPFKQRLYGQYCRQAWRKVKHPLLNSFIFILYH